MSEEHGAAVAEPEVETIRQTREDTRQKPKRQPRYHVLLWNDDFHTYDYVVLMMRKLFGHPPEKGLLIAAEVDLRGKAIVMTTTREHAEFKREQIHSYGKDDGVQNCKGSMWSTIEPEMC
ncbi:MAG: ATP-dependent Clp protease adaptor ClpS [Planctomycetota bacterium]|nr:ATP-dependent Clp protease adaptor ClpS [Planctomycetota bacterium]